MGILDIKKFVTVAALSLAAVLGTSVVASAQRHGNDDRRYRNDDRRYRNNDQDNERQISQQQQKLYRQRVKAEQKRIREEQKRLAKWNRQHRYNGNVYSNGNNSSNGNRYRVYRNGSYYHTDRRGAELLRQAVNSGYQQGYRAGQIDRSNRRRSSWTINNDYRAGNYGYQNGVDRRQYQYYFQQGFQRGYQDGYNARNQYGNYNNGSGSILGAILGQILNIQRY